MVAAKKKAAPKVTKPRITKAAAAAAADTDADAGAAIGLDGVSSSSLSSSKAKKDSLDSQNSTLDKTASSSAEPKNGSSSSSNSNSNEAYTEITTHLLNSNKSLLKSCHDSALLSTEFKLKKEQQLSTKKAANDKILLATLEEEENVFVDNLRSSIVALICAEISQASNASGTHGMKATASHQQIVFQAASMLQCFVQALDVVNAGVLAGANAGEIDAMSVTQIEQLARIQAEAVINAPPPSSSSSSFSSSSSERAKAYNLDADEEREKEMKIRLQEQALVYSHCVQQDAQGSMHNVNLQYRRQVDNMRIKLRGEYRSRYLKLSESQKAKSANLEYQQIIAEDQYQMSAKEFMLKVRAQRPYASKTQVEETEGLLLINTIQQFEGFQQQMTILHSQFEGKRKGTETEIDGVVEVIDDGDEEGCDEDASMPNSATSSSSQFSLNEPIASTALSIWNSKISVIENTNHKTDAIYKANASLPLARVKRIMKADESVKMIASEAPTFMAKACEMFITDLGLKALVLCRNDNRRMIVRTDVVRSVTETTYFDFLVDVLQPKMGQEEWESEKEQDELGVIGEGKEEMQVDGYDAEIEVVGVKAGGGGEEKVGVEGEKVIGEGEGKVEEEGEKEEAVASECEAMIV